MTWLSTSEAARQLAITEQQVRRLARAGRLPSRHVAGRWLIGSSAVRARAGTTQLAGRPPSPVTAWALLHLLADSSASGEDISGVWHRVPDRRLRFRLRRLLDDGPAVETWSQWLRRRAAVQRTWVHPGVLERLALDGRLSATGDYAVALGGHGLAAGPARLFYVAAENAGGVLEEYRGQLDDKGQVHLLVIPSVVPSALRPTPGEAVPATIALVDLLDSPDARQQGLARDTLCAARKRLQSDRQVG